MPPLINMFVLFFVIWWWIPLGGFICGLFAIADFVRHKHQIVMVHGFRHKKGDLRALDISVTSNLFVEELRNLNPGVKQWEWWRFW